MELTVEDLDIGANYTVDIWSDVCRNMMGCENDHVSVNFQATAEEISETFYIVTDNFTCNLGVRVELHENR